MSEKEDKEKDVNPTTEKRKEDVLRVIHEVKTPKTTDKIKEDKENKDKDKDDPVPPKPPVKTKEKPILTQEQIDAIIAEKEELEQMVEISALSEFQREKDALLAKIEGEDKRKEVAEIIGDDPDKLENIKTITRFLATNIKEAGVEVTGDETVLNPKDGDKDGNPDDKTGKTTETKEKDGKTDEEEEEDDIETPKGKPAPPSGVPSTAPETKGGYKKFVDELYRILLDPKSTDLEKTEANRRLDELFSEIFRAVKEKQQMPFVSITQCPNCGALLGANTDSCDVCGWKHMVSRGR